MTTNPFTEDRTVLCLTMKPGDTVYLNDTVAVTLIASRSRKARVGFEASKNVVIRRAALVPEEEQTLILKKIKEKVTS